MTMIIRKNNEKNVNAFNNQLFHGHHDDVDSCKENDADDVAVADDGDFDFDFDCVDEDKTTMMMIMKMMTMTEITIGRGC